MRQISSLRFNAMAGYYRHPMALIIAEEVGWFEHGGERVLGVVIRDSTDNDFSGIVLARDKLGRFRWVSSTSFEPTIRRAKVLLRPIMEQFSMKPDEEYYQGDELGTPLDFFKPCVSREKLNPNFLAVLEKDGYSSAREIIQQMMHYYKDLDGNFIEQFQTTGFNSRIWELYLFATFVEMGYLIDHIHTIPDFICIGPLGQFAVEATTINPTRNKTGEIVPPPDMEIKENIRPYLTEYMPIKFGSSLTSKLGKKYWEKPSVAGKPLLFAIQDFSSPFSMTFTRSALGIYLYGYNHIGERDQNGNLIIKSQKIETHCWGKKVIPSGFFNLPDSENVSAVIYNNSGTVSKFSRMGLLAGFGSPGYYLVRKGTVFDHNPNASDPLSFSHLVNAAAYNESWVEGFDVYHNPHAKHPITDEMFPGAAHHRLLPNGNIESLIPDWHPLTSITNIFKT